MVNDPQNDSNTSDEQERSDVTSMSFVLFGMELSKLVHPLQQKVMQLERKIDGHLQAQSAEVTELRNNL